MKTFSTPVKVIISRRLLVGALWNKMMSFGVTLFFYVNIVFILSISKITTSFLIFPLIVSRQHNLKHASAVYAKHKQVRTKTKKSSLQKLPKLWVKKFSKKNRDTPSFAQSFSILETFSNSKTALRKFEVFLVDKHFLASFRDTLL